MKNNYLFWENYLKKVKTEINNLCQQKDSLYIDLHIHSNYSADGKQSVQEILETTEKQGFDVIAITDHDQIDAYNEIFDIVKKGLTKPIIIPGIEFTMDNREYGNQCHFLQLFVNPKDEIFNKDVRKNYNANFKRSRIQFKRLKDNEAIQEILKKYHFTISYKEYITYLNNHNQLPEYDTLCSYLMEKFKKYHITNFMILDLLEKYNLEDCYSDRKEYKTKRYQKLKEKYIQNQENNYNTRFLLSMLAVREVDDDWWDLPSSGSLSVNSYGQLKIEELNNKYPIYFAHPNQDNIKIVEKILQQEEKIVGLEKNMRNSTLDIPELNKFTKKMKRLQIIGSDSHDASLVFYQDMNFYNISSKDLLKIIKGE